jgi:protein deglycase
MKALMIVSDHMEDVEALGTRALLIRAGISVVTATVDDRATVTTAFGLRFEPDSALEDLFYDDFDALVIPGGRYVGLTIDKDKAIGQAATVFARHDKVVAAICAGPRFLGRAGLLDGKRFTAYPGSENDAPDGTYCPEEKAVTDGNIITARGAGVIYAFAYAITEKLLGKEAAEGLFSNIRH